MVIEIDKKHRVKKTAWGWLPQWRKYFLWHSYTIWHADVECGLFTEYDKWQSPPYFKDEKYAVEFVKSAIDRSDCDGAYFIEMNEGYPEGLV